MKKIFLYMILLSSCNTAHVSVKQPAKSVVLITKAKSIPTVADTLFFKVINSDTFYMQQPVSIVKGTDTISGNWFSAGYENSMFDTVFKVPDTKKYSVKIQIK